MPLETPWEAVLLRVVTCGYLGWMGTSQSDWAKRSSSAFVLLVALVAVSFGTAAAPATADPTRMKPFSIAVLPDTQHYVEMFRYPQRVEYFTAQTTALKIPTPETMPSHPSDATPGTIAEGMGAAFR